MRNPCRTTLRGAIRHVLSAAISLGCASGALAQAAPPEPSGLGTSSEYILGFIQYVRWPAEESIRTWQVCVPSAPASKAASYSGRTARGRPLTVRQVAASDALAECQILDLTDAPAASAKPLLAQARKQPVLTIGAGSHFCSAGGVICLRARDSAGGFEINLSAVQEAGLNVNAQLLMLGRRRQAASGGM